VPLIGQPLLERVGCCNVAGLWGSLSIGSFYKSYERALIRNPHRCHK
jgi:hypothetical protein